MAEMQSAVSLDQTDAPPEIRAAIARLGDDLARAAGTNLAGLVLYGGLARAMGDAFAVGFANYARANPLPSEGGPLADGRAFAGWLERAGLLSDEARLEAFAFDARAIRFAMTW
jgi:hypothetical protein